MENPSKRFAKIELLTSKVGYAFSVAFHYTHKFLDGSVLPRLRRFIVFGMGGFLVASVGSGIFRATGGNRRAHHLIRIGLSPSRSEEKLPKAHRKACVASGASA